jgi:SAM-dependent methyltransferase
VLVSGGTSGLRRKIEGRISPKIACDASFHLPGLPVPQNQFIGPVAELYDATSTEMFDPALVDATTDFLATAAAAGPALEFGIGTGRIALPLSQRGVKVHGIDISADMVDQLRRKPDSDPIGTTVGDFAETVVPGVFSLVYVVYNSISNLLEQSEWVQAFRNAARHLGPGGRFVVELWIPDLRHFPPGAAAIPFAVSPTHLGFDTLDTATQRGVSHHYFVAAGGDARFDSPFRYAWPAELDLMAQIAGMTLRERWADWDRSPFTSESPKHISVWERP